MHDLPKESHDILDKAVSKQVDNAACILSYLLTLPPGNIVDSRLHSSIFFTIVRTLFILVRFVIMVGPNGIRDRFINALHLPSSVFDLCVWCQGQKLATSLIFKMTWKIFCYFIYDNEASLQYTIWESSYGHVSGSAANSRKKGGWGPVFLVWCSFCVINIIFICCAGWYFATVSGSVEEYNIQ